MKTEPRRWLLSDYTTFHLGGPCATFMDCRSPEEVCDAIRDLRSRQEPHVLLGGGSNLLVSDAGVDAAIVRFVQPQAQIRTTSTGVEAEAGTALDELAAFTSTAGLEGLMCCTGIPGTVGGAIVGNAGAWGRQIADVLESVTLLNATGRVHVASPEALNFAYRRSGLQQAGDIVLNARFRLMPAPPDRLAEERRDILAKRAERHPDLRTQPCIGSFFRNIEPTSAAGRRQAAGWYLERAGAKKMRVGGARVFERHANIIVKEENGTAQDVYDLASMMQAVVKEMFQIELVREVRFLGPFRGEEGAPVATFY